MTLPGLPLDRVEGELRALWDREGPGVTRARTMTVVALCEKTARADDAARALAVAAPAHGARTVLVVPTAEHEAKVFAEVALHRSSRGTPCAESIRIHASEGARAFVPDVVSRVLAPDLPVFVWWVGDLPDHETLLDRVAFGARATVAVVDASAMDLRDLAVLDALVRRPLSSRGALGSDAAGIAVADFCWQRLRTWQEMIARFFDDDVCARDLPTLTRIRVAFNPRARHAEPRSNQAAVLVGWLAARLGLGPARWTRPGVASLGRRGGGEVEVAFEPTPRDELFDGSLVEVELVCALGRYRVCRGDEPSVLCREGSHPLVAVPAQCVRAAALAADDSNDGVLLARVLERPLRDPLFEASLRAAASLVAEIARGPA